MASKKPIAKPPPVPKSLLHDEYMDNDLYDDVKRTPADIDEDMNEDEIDQLVIAAQARSGTSRRVVAPARVPLKAKKFAKVLGIPAGGARYIARPRQVVAYDEPEIFDDLVDEPAVKRSFGGNRVIVRSRDNLPALPPIQQRLSMLRNRQHQRQSDFGRERITQIRRPNFKRSAMPNRSMPRGRPGRNDRGGGGGQRPRGKLTAEDLDRELDSYMKGGASSTAQTTRGGKKGQVSADDLDADLDSYMQGGSGGGGGGETANVKHPRVSIS